MNSHPPRSLLLTWQSLFCYVIICTPSPSKTIALVRRKSRHLSCLPWHRKQPFEKKKVEISVMFSAIKWRQSCSLLKDLLVSAPLNPSLLLVMLLCYITKTVGHFRRHPQCEHISYCQVYVLS